MRFLKQNHLRFSSELPRGEVDSMNLFWVKQLSCSVNICKHHRVLPSNPSSKDGRIESRELINLNIVSLVLLQAWFIHFESSSSTKQIPSKKRTRIQQSWQRVKAIKLSREIPFERWRNNLYFFISRSVFQLQFMLEISTHTQRKTWELVVKHIRNCFYVSVFRCSSILLKSKIACCCCRLGTFSREKSCLIIFRHKYECILACD